MPHCIGNVFDLSGKCKDRDVLILGAASTVKYYKKNILNLIKKNRLVVIGINNITHIIIPDYHLWTNNKRLETFGGCIDKQSTILLGCNILKDTIERMKFNYYNVPYVDTAFQGIFKEPGFYQYVIKGSFRVAGNLAIAIASILGARNIYYAGVDGYSQPFNGDQHCYGNGLTDSCDMKYEKAKDEIIYNCLKSIHSKIPFKIITPTLFKEFYDQTLLAANTKSGNN